MSKTEMIKEAEEKLQQEKLEKEKQNALAELRVIENRIDYAKNAVKTAEGFLEKKTQELEEEEAAAVKYIQTGDYEAYQEELGISPCYAPTFISCGSGVSSLTGTQFHYNAGIWVGCKP